MRPLYPRTLLAGVALAISAIPAVAQASTAHARVATSDAAATRTYLKADYVETRAVIAAIPQAVADVKALGAGVKSQCPSALPGAPQPAPNTLPSASAADLGIEALYVTVLTLEHPDHRIFMRFDRVVKHLRWSNRKLTRIALAESAGEVAVTAVRLPNLCTDFNAWAASGYQTVPPGTRQFIHEVNLITVSSQNAPPDEDKFIAHALAAYEDPVDKSIARHVKHLHDRMQRLLLAALEKYGSGAGLGSE